MNKEAALTITQDQIGAHQFKTFSQNQEQFRKVIPR